jgi:hypothetical protein
MPIIAVTLVVKVRERQPARDTLPARRDACAPRREAGLTGGSMLLYPAIHD